MNRFILLSHWNGRFGNRMHQYAYGVTYSKLNKVPFILPSHWEGTHLFKTQHHMVLDNDDLRLRINQTSKELGTFSYREQSMKELYPNIRQVHPEMADANYMSYLHPVYFDSVCAYSEHIFKPMSKTHLLEVFEFSDEVKSTDAYKFWSDKQGTYNIAHLRRDDISNAEYNKNNPQGYSVVSTDAYKKAFRKFGMDENEIIWISDDRTGVWHQNNTAPSSFGWSYPFGSHYRAPYVFDWLEDFLKLYFAKTIFRANSSFSWWAAFLAPTAKVYSPVMNKQHIYGVDGLEEIEVEFVEGNQPHWMYKQSDIVVN